MDIIDFVNTEYFFMSCKLGQEKNNNITSTVQLLSILPRDIVYSIIKFF